LAPTRPVRLWRALFRQCWEPGSESLFRIRFFLIWVRIPYHAFAFVSFSVFGFMMIHTMNYRQGSCTFLQWLARGQQKISYFFLQNFLFLIKVPTFTTVFKESTSVRRIRTSYYRSGSGRPEILKIRIWNIGFLILYSCLSHKSMFALFEKKIYVSGSP